MKVERLQLCLTGGGRRVTMGSLPLPAPPGRPRGSLTLPRCGASPWPEACTRAASGLHGPGPAAPSYLHGVGADDLAAQPLAELQRQGGFAGARGPENHYKRQCPLHAPEPGAHRHGACSRRRRRHLEDICACAGAAVPMATVRALVPAWGSAGRASREEAAAEPRSPGSRRERRQLSGVTAPTTNSPTEGLAVLSKIELSPSFFSSTQFFFFIALITI